MRPFRFRLQRVLDLSGRVVKARAIELGTAVALEREAAQRLSAAQGLRERRLRDLTVRQQQGIAPWEWAAFVGYLAGLKDEEARLADDLAIRCEQTDACRARLLEQRREQKALEALRRRALETYKVEEEQEERKLLDDLASSRYAREQAAGEHGGTP